MQYLYEQGVHYGFGEKIKQAAGDSLAMRWLPIGVIGIVGLWLILVLASALQKAPITPGIISHHPTKTTTLAVAPASASVNQNSSSNAVQNTGTTSAMQPAGKSGTNVSNTAKTASGTSVATTTPVNSTPVVSTTPSDGSQSGDTSNPGTGSDQGGASGGSGGNDGSSNGGSGASASVCVDPALPVLDPTTGLCIAANTTPLTNTLGL